MDAGWDKYSSNTVKGEEELTHWDHGFSDAIWDPQYLLIPGKTVLSITITPLASLPHCSQHVSQLWCVLAATTRLSQHTCTRQAALTCWGCMSGILAWQQLRSAWCQMAPSRAGLMPPGMPRGRVLSSAVSLLESSLSPFIVT